MSRLCVRSDDYLFYLLTFSLISLCTILRPQRMTPGITCDSTSPMTDELGPLVRPRTPIRYSIHLMRTAQPPVGLSRLPLHSIPFYSTLFYSFLFYSITPPTSFTSIRFHSFLFESFPHYSLCFHVLPEISEPCCI